MKKTIVTLLIWLVFGVVAYCQQTLFLNDGRLVDSILPTVPTRNVEVFDNEVIVTYDFTSAILLKDDLYEGSFWWKMDGFGLNEIVGEPSILDRIDMFGIPQGMSGKVEILESEYQSYSYTLTPARPPLTNSGNEKYTKDNVKPINISLGTIPKEIVRECGVEEYRGHYILNVQVFPIQYDPANQVVKAYTHIKYRVSFSNISKANSESFFEGKIPSLAPTDNFLSNVLINMPANKQAKSITSTIENRQDYLIISLPKYKDAIDEFAEWKKLMGFNVYVELKDSWTPTLIKNTVRTIYQNSGHLEYLLIVGDHEDVPATNSTLNKIHITDLYYGCMGQEDDYIPDISIGRLSVTTLTEAQVVARKIINYEREPITDANFYQNGINCAYFQDDGTTQGESVDGFEDRMFVKTAEDVRSYLQTKGKIITRIYNTREFIQPTNWNKQRYANGEPIPSELLRSSGFMWNGNANDIINKINLGVFYVLHRDHGSPFGWGDPRFYQNDISQLSNHNKLPVVFSMNCQTGEFNGQTCFAETFLRKSNGGCVAIYGASDTSYSGYNDILTGGMFDAVWPFPGLIIKEFGQTANNIETLVEPIYQIGRILNQGLMRLRELYGQNRLVRYTQELFHCFGDPSMQIYTETPTSFANISISRETKNVTVLLGNGEVATITFYNLINGEVKSYIGTSAVYNTPTPQYISVCVSAHNKIPYIQTGAIPPDNVYIQNKTVTSYRTYIGKSIKIGSNVTSDENPGPVLFNGGTIDLYGHEVQIQSGTTIDVNTEFNVITQ